jgi:hypothetical protein
VRQRHRAGERAGQYKYQGRLAGYEGTCDPSSHGFIEYLPKGTCVSEYPTRIQPKGTYQTGLAEIQCLHAPEFNSHSESMTLSVKEDAGGAAQRPGAS